MFVRKKLSLVLLLVFVGMATGFAQKLSLESEMARFYGEVWQSHVVGMMEVLILLDGSYIYMNEPPQYSQQDGQSVRPHVEQGTWSLEVFVEITQPSVVRFYTLHFVPEADGEKWSRAAKADRGTLCLGITGGRCLRMVAQIP